MIRTRRAGRNHWYVNEKDEKVPQVSAIVKAGVDKSGPLTQWVAQITADFVLDNWEKLAAMPLSERYWTIRKVAQDARNTAATKGTKFHVLVQKLADGEEVEYDRTNAELVADVQAALTFIHDFDAQTVLSEATIWSERWNYAGRFDTIQSLATGPPERLYENWLLDYKRANRVYPENALQTEGYGGADWVVTEDGDAVAMPPIDHLGIVHINRELPGGYALIPVPDDRRPELAEYFHHAQHMAHFAEIGDEFLGDPVEPPVWADDEEEDPA